MMTPNDLLASQNDPHLKSEARRALVEEIRSAANSLSGWDQIRSAEMLVWQGYPEEVIALLRDKVESAPPQERIGVWRVMAQAESTPAARRAMIDRIRAAFADPSATDRVHAAESLAKLDYHLDDAEKPLFVEMSESSDLAAAAFPTWVLAISGEPGARESLMTILKSSDPIGRVRAAYSLSRLSPEWPDAVAETEALRVAALAEPADSPYRALLVGAAWLRATNPGDKQTLKATLDKLADSSDVGTRTSMLMWIAERGAGADVPLLEKLAADPDQRVRVAAANARLRIERRIPRHLQFVDWAVIGAYVVGMLLIGWYYSGRSTTTEDYMLGGRQMQSWAVGLSLFATMVSTISYLTWPGEVIQHGPMVLCGLLSYPLILLIVTRFLIPYFMRLRVTSAYEILELRLGISVRVLGSLFFLSLRLLWMAVIIYATTTKVIIPMIGLDPSAAPLVGMILGIVTVIYTAQGGLRAVVATDVVQSIILVGGAVIAMVVVTIDLGGVSQWWPTSWAPHWQKPIVGPDPGARITLVGAFIATLTWYVCTAGSDQMAIQRYLATRDVEAARRMYKISVFSSASVEIFLCILGFALLAYFRAHREILADGQSLSMHADQMFPRFIVAGLPPGLTGLVVSGLLAAAMSSLSSGLNSSCSVVTVDFIDRFRRKRDSETQHVLLAKYVSVALGTLVVLLSLAVGLVEGNLLELAYKVVNLLVAPLFGLFFMAMFVPWATSFGTIVGAVAGVVVVTAINFWKELTGMTGISFMWAMPAALIVQIVIGSLFSLLPIGHRRPTTVLTDEAAAAGASVL